MKISEKAQSTIESKFKNKKLELQIIKYLLTIEPVLCTGIEFKWFSIQPLQEIFKVINNLRVCLTKETLLYELQKSGLFKSDSGDFRSVFKHYIDETFKVSLSGINPGNIRVLIKQIYELSESRRILLSIRNMMKYINSFNVDKVKRMFKNLSRDNFTPDEYLTGNYLDDYEKRLSDIELKADEGEVLIPTGISKFDWQIGGIMPGEFGVIIGRTGLGKTAMLVCMAIHAWLQGYNVVFATGEMRKILIQYRMDSNLVRIDSNKFRTGKFTMEDFKRWGEKIDGLRQIQNSFLEVGSFSRNFNTDNISDWLHRLQDKHKKPIHILFIDYLNIMSAIKMKGDRGDWQSQANTVWDVKTLTETFNNGRLCTWTAGQIKDEFFESEKLSVDAAKYARAISETAPIIVGLVQTTDDLLYRVMQLQILKMRNSKLPKESIILHPDLDHMRINDRAKNRHKSLFDLEREEKPKKEKRRGSRKRSLGR